MACEAAPLAKKIAMGLRVACVASVSVRFRSKEKGTRVKDGAKNGARKGQGRGWGRKEGKKKGKKEGKKGFLFSPPLPLSLL